MSQIYRKLWWTLNQTRLQPTTQQLVGGKCSATFSQVFNHFKNTSHVKIMNLGNLDVSDITYLDEQGISLEYLLRNLRKTTRGGHLDSLAFQLTAINEKAVYAICPFTGKHVSSHHSLLANINALFYRFESTQVFYVIIAGLDGFKKQAIYFPQQEIVVTTGKSWTFEEADLIELQAKMVCNFDACYRYLSNNVVSNKRVAVCIGFFHFAHHLWNELPGIARLVRKRMINSIDKFLVLREPLGPIEQIFPEIPTHKVDRKISTDAMFAESLESGYFLVRIGNYLVTRDTVARVYEVAKTNCRPEMLNKVREAQRQHSPLLWIGIRVGSRTWANQVDGLARLIAKLHSKFPRLGVVFDGFSLPADRSGVSSDNQEYADILRQENRVISEIVGRLEQSGQSTIGLFNIVGGAIYDAIVWANAIDVYVSPYGTLQHKVGWFANNPGIIHTNTTVLENAAKYVWTPIENAITPRYVRRAAVTDIKSTEKAPIIYREVSDLKESGAGNLSAVERVQSDPDFDNYELDWRALYDDLNVIIRSPKIIYKFDHDVMIYNLRKKVKMFIHIFTNFFDHCKI